MMSVSGTGPSAAKRRILAVICAFFCAACGISSVLGQSANPSSAANPYFGSVTLKPATDEVVQLTLDEAIRRGLENNLGLRQAVNSERAIHAEQLQALQEFLPTITLTGDTGFYQHDLAALGFKGSNLPPDVAVHFPAVTHDTLTEGQIHLDQILFSGPVISGWKAAGAATRSAYFAKMTARGEVIQQVASAYLHAIASASEVDNSEALEQANLLQLNHAHEQRVAGVATSLDELRARVQYQIQQQATIAAQNSLDKDLILLKREIGLDPGQKIALTDPAPFSELTEQTPEELRALAYKSRQDYQNLQNQVVELKAVHDAYRSQRYPTLRFSGNYGVQAITTIGSHGVFTAVGTLSVPIFREAGLRGDIDASQAQLNAVHAQLDDLRTRIDQQVRSALLDVNAARKLVAVTRSNVDLSTRALSDQTERVNAGIDDTLPLVTAQAALAGAQTSMVESVYQYNLAKLSLARAAGVLEQQYHYYLGK
jgi:outer membrane protein TolC